MVTLHGWRENAANGLWTGREPENTGQLQSRIHGNAEFDQPVNGLND